MLNDLEKGYKFDDKIAKNKLLSFADAVGLVQKECGLLFEIYNQQDDESEE